jgi:hypothetical protein
VTATQVQLERTFSDVAGVSQVADERRDAVAGREFWKSGGIFDVRGEMDALLGVVWWLGRLVSGPGCVT